MTMHAQTYNTVAARIRDAANAHIVANEGEGDFNRIARLGGLAALRLLAENLANTFEKDNPRFDREKFLEACKF